MTPLKAVADVEQGTEVNQLRQENAELRERVRQLEADQELALQLNQLLLEKLHFMSDDILAQPYQNFRPL